MKNLLHKLAHKLNINNGTCDSFYDKDGRLMMSFLCEGCGQRSGVHCVDSIIDRELQ